MTPFDDLNRLRAALRSWSDQDLEAALAKLNRRQDVEAQLSEQGSELRRVLAQWDDERIENGLRALHFRQDQSSRQRWRAALWTVVAAAAALVLWFVSSRPAAHPEAKRAPQREPSAPQRGAQGSPAATERRLSLRDGSSVELADAGSRVRIDEQTPERVVVKLETGRAEFVVEHRAERRFIVKVGGIEIEDLGTAFSVERGADDVLVRVSKGKVRISWQRQSAELVLGQERRFPLEGSPADPAPAPTVSAATNSSSPATWRQAASAGHYQEAFAQLESEGFESVHGSARDLLLAADVARFSGHPDRAIVPLRDLLARYPSHPQTPAAAFTLGSVLLRNLNRPGEAAGAFEDVLRLAPSGNLAEDAAARATEAWLQAGNRARARAAYDRYVARYPNGRHLAFLERLLQHRAR